MTRVAFIEALLTRVETVTRHHRDLLCDGCDEHRVEIAEDAEQDPGETAARAAVVEPERTVSVRAFLPIPREAKKGPSEYDDVYRVLRSEHRDVVFEQAMKDVSALRAKYQALTDFDAVLRSALKSGKKKAA